jgi:NAD-dependent deacetylase
MKKKIVVLSGAGISAESGITTFRDSGGLWEGYDVMEVASPSGWNANPELVLDFYNQRRKQLFEVHPNVGHSIIASWEKNFKVTVITQNIDDLHERSGSTHVIHLHGELKKARSTTDSSLTYVLKDWKLEWGDLCEKGSQLRPDVVWFGEPVPAMETAIRETLDADILVVVGTSLVVYPAAGLVNYVEKTARKFIVDPNMPETEIIPNLVKIEEKASTGLMKVSEALKNLTN